MEIILIKIKIVNIFSKINYEMKMWIFFGADLLIDIWWEKMANGVSLSLSSSWDEKKENAMCEVLMVMTQDGL